MEESEGGSHAATRGFAVVALALAGLAFSWTPAAERLDAALLDAQWSMLRKFAYQPAPDDIIIVGIDDATVRAIPEPPGLWHEPLGRALVRIASAKPRAIGLDVVLPERSFDTLRAGMDRALMVGLAAARQNGPFVVALTIDVRTHAARPIHTPLLAVLGDAGLGIGIFARDIDGVTRRFSLVLPTEDGGFPTLSGRLCRALSKRCGDGFINYALGKPFLYVPLKQVLETQDTQLLEKLFRGRIVMIGETQPYTDRVAVPVNFAGWESARADSPGVVVHAQSLRTALLNAAPEDVSRPAILVLVTLAAMLVLMRDWRLALVTGVLGAVGLFVASVLALRGGLFVPTSAAFATLAAAWASSAAFQGWREWRGRESLRRGFAGYVSPAVLSGILRGKIPAGRAGSRAKVAFVFVGMRSANAGTPAALPEEAMALINRFHEAVAGAVHRHDGTLDGIRGDGAMAIFGTPKALANPPRAAWSSIKDLFRGLERLNAELARQGRPAADLAVGADFGDAVAGQVGSKSGFNFTAVGEGAHVALRLHDEARRRGFKAVVSGAFREQLGEDAAFEPLGPLPVAGLAPVQAWGWKG
jgi:class 3 adenylate cyclase/CHASE2 domain-containing sensor protein